MLKKILLFLALPLGLFAAPTVSNIRVTDTSHSSLRITWDINVSASEHRLRYGSTTAYEGDTTYGGIVPASYFTGNINIQADLSGGAGGIIYHFCPQSSSDGGATWSVCVDTVVVFPSLPGTHPALPIAPTTRSTAFPSVVGYATFPVAVGCGNLDSQLSAAEASRATGGKPVVIIPAGGCGVNSKYLPGAGDAKYFTTANVDTTGNKITYNAHGFSNGDRIAFGQDQRNGPQPLTLSINKLYYACNITINTFQVCSDVGLATVVAISDPGHAGQCVVDLSTQSNTELIIAPEWPLGTGFRVPEGVRYDSTARTTWAGNLTAKFFMTSLGAGNVGLKAQQCLHDWRFVIELTTGNTTEISTSTDPTPWGTLMDISGDTANLTFDRSWIHGQGYPDRTSQGIKVQGRNQAIINSEVGDLDYWLAGVNTLTDLVATVASGSKTTLSTGDYNLGPGVCNLGSAEDFDITGGAATGSLLLYYDMACGLQAIGPVGLTVTCSTCTYSTMATPVFPVNGAGNRAAGRIAQVSVLAGAFTTVANTFRPGNGGTTVYSGGEGPTGILPLCAGTQGPTQLINNLIESAGIGVHFDDSCSSTNYTDPGKDITVNRNCICLRNSWVPSDPSFDHHLRLVRNLFETKKGLRISITGNTFRNEWASVTPQGYAVTLFPTKAFSGTTDPQTTDVDISNNSALNVSAGFQLAANIPGSTGVTPPMLRIRSNNNLIRQYKALYDPALKNGTTLYGFCWFIWGAIEDSTQDHNTCISDGLGAFFSYHVNQQQEGFVNTNGIYVMADPLDRRGFGLELDFSTGSNPISPTPPVTFGKALLDWTMTRGAHVPSYTFNPVLVPWTSSSCPHWNTDWAGSGATVVTGANCATSTATDRLNAVGFNSFGTGDYSLSSGSAYHNAALDGTDFGVNFTTLNAAIGTVGTPIVSSITDTTATVTTPTPDTFACGIIISLDGFVTPIYVPYSGSPSTTQVQALTGLTAAATYDGYSLCAVSQPHFTFTTTGARLGDVLGKSTLGGNLTIR